MIAGNLTGWARHVGPIIGESNAYDMIGFVHDACGGSGHWSTLLGAIGSDGMWGHGSVGPV